MGMRKSLASANGPRHDILDVIRVAAWYSEIEKRLGCRSTYSVESELEPEAFGSTKDGLREKLYHRNKWRRYRTGRSKPQKALIDRVDERLPGTEALLNHVLWESIRGKRNTQWLLKEGLRRLSPEVQQIIFKPDSNIRPVSYSDFSINIQKLRRLERRASVDVLACLTILLRDAVAHGHSKMAWKIAFSLRRVLLIVCSLGPFQFISPCMFALYSQWIVPFVPAEDGISDIAAFDFQKAMEYLHHRVLQLEDAYAIGLSYDDSVHAMIDLLNGKYANDSPIDDEMFTVEI